jgi:transglutaminase-like putative cysteine protease
MIGRLSGVAGLAGIGLVLFRLAAALRMPVPAQWSGYPAWQWWSIVASASVAAAVLTTVLLRLRIRLRWNAFVNAVCCSWVVLLVASSGTGWWGFPTAAVVERAGEAFDAARLVAAGSASGIPPIGGVVAAAAALLWMLGALWAAGVSSRTPLLAVLPPLVVFLELAMLDSPGGLGWIVLFLSILGISLAAVAADQRHWSAGRFSAAAKTGPNVWRTSPTAAMTTLAVVVLVAASSAWAVGSASASGAGEPGPLDSMVAIHRRLVERSDRVVFTAEIDGSDSGVSGYWRGAVLDRFDGSAWRPSERPAVDALEAPAGAVAGALVQRVTLVRPPSQFWVPALGHAIRAESGDVPLRVDPRTGLVLTAGPVPAPASYSVESAGNEAPDDLAPYLALPPDLDPRIPDRATGLVSDAGSPAEQTARLLGFFDPANGFRYETTLGAGSGSVAAWLFDDAVAGYRTGYCEQFASALAVMARSAGIPARVVIGFAAPLPGPGGSVVVRDRDAHAWVEAWIEDDGWVTLDPTPASTVGSASTSTSVPVTTTQPGVRGGGTTVTTASGTGAGNTAAPGSWTTAIRWLGAVSAAGVLLVSIPIAKAARRRRRLRRLSAGEMPAGWAEITDRLTDLGSEPPRSATPLEVAATVDTAMTPLAGAYGEFLYAPGALAAGRAATATESLLETERILEARYPLRRKIWARLRPGSLLPASLRGRTGRRPR